jgi:glycosyltransferase involved in cell wall biosynthesis
VVAPRRNLDALASGLTRLLDDAELRRRVGRDGQDFVRTQFDWERATARLESILAAR